MKFATVLAAIAIVHAEDAGDDKKDDHTKTYEGAAEGSGCEANTEKKGCKADLCCAQYTEMDGKTIDEMMEAANEEEKKKMEAAKEKGQGNCMKVANAGTE